MLCLIFYTILPKGGKVMTLDHLIFARDTCHVAHSGVFLVPNPCLIYNVKENITKHLFTRKLVHAGREMHRQ